MEQLKRRKNFGWHTELIVFRLERLQGYWAEAIDLKDKRNLYELWTYERWKTLFAITAETFENPANYLIAWIHSEKNNCVPPSSEYFCV